MRYRDFLITNQKGSLLIFTIWVLVIIGLFTTAVGYQARQRLRFLQSMEYRSILRNMADAGIIKALQLVKEKQEEDSEQEQKSVIPAWFYNPALAKVPLGQGYYSISYRNAQGNWMYGVVDEERKINLNEMTSIHTLKQLIKSVTDLDDNESGNVAASIMDWKDEDDVLNAGGAETRHYRLQKPAYSAKNKPLDSLDELLLVKGVTPEVYTAIEPYLSLVAENAININTAPAPVLLAKGMSENLTAKLIEYRAGKDGKLMTYDDRYFDKLSEAISTLQSAIALSTDEKESLASFMQSGDFDVRSHHYTARVEGHIESRNESLERICVITRQGEVLNCYENYYRMAASQKEAHA